MKYLKTISIGKWVLDVDLENTSENSKMIERCNCLPCQNFRKQIINHNVKLNDFLLLLGIDITCPEELVWFEGNRVEQTVQYIAYYSVSGKIKEFDEYEIDIDNLNVVISAPDTASINTGSSDPYFIVSIHNIYLDWEMEEEYDNVFFVENQKSRNKKLNKVFKKSLEIGENRLLPIDEIVEKTYPNLQAEEKVKLALTVDKSRKKIFDFIYNNYKYNNEENDKAIEKGARDLIKHYYPWMNEKNIKKSINQGFYYACHG